MGPGFCRGPLFSAIQFVAILLSNNQRYYIRQTNNFQEAKEKG